jgi:hypothetical protein
MGLTIVLQTEMQRDTLASVGDTQDYLSDLLPPPSDTSYRCLCFVDRYEHTMFNHLQMDAFLLELERIRGAASQPDAISLLDAIRQLAEQCRDADGRLFLWFYGD